MLHTNINGYRTVLAGDVGATKTDLALFRFEGNDYHISRDRKYVSADYNDLTLIIKDFIQNDPSIEKMVFGVAGPVQNGKVKMSNLKLEADSDQLAKKFRIPVYLINDLEATAYGLNMLKNEDVYVIYDSGKKAEGNMAVIAPGTGLGEAGLYWDGKMTHPFATEGGHCDFSPRDEKDIEFYLYLHAKYDHVSLERVLSGPGIVHLYEFLKDKKGRTFPAEIQNKMLSEAAAAVITHHAYTDSFCKEIVGLFFRYLAFEAANLCLKLNAKGGIFIGGGIITKIHQLLDENSFLENFRASGRLKYFLEDVPVKIILNEKTALLGAAYYGAVIR